MVRLNEETTPVFFLHETGTVAFDARFDPDFHEMTRFNSDPVQDFLNDAVLSIGRMGPPFISSQILRLQPARLLALPARVGPDLCESGSCLVDFDVRLFQTLLDGLQVLSVLAEWSPGWQLFFQPLQTFA